MIKLFQFPACWGLPNPSPFCLKLETYLRMAKLPYEVKFVKDPRKAPKAKFPFIIDNSNKIADSGFIINYLKETYGDSLDSALSPFQKAQTLALQRLIEEHLYWVLVQARWFDPNNWETTNKSFFTGLSFPLNYLLPKIIRKTMRRDMLGQGMARHTQDEMYELGVADLKAINSFLDEHKFLVSDGPSSIDATGYAFIANILEPPIESPLKEYIKSQKNLVNYCREMKNRYW